MTGGVVKQYFRARAEALRDRIPPGVRIEALGGFPAVPEITAAAGPVVAM
jgi:hypothetical protein